MRGPIASRTITADPATTIDAATIAGASTGAAQGTGIRNKMSQVQTDAGQPSKSFRKR